jgi:hypothetical protein
LNHQPTDYKSVALPVEPWGRKLHCQSNNEV